MSKSHSLVVVGIDIGNTFVRYGFSVHMDIDTDPGEDVFNHKDYSLMEPATLLFDENKEFHSFGSEAEQNYAHLAEDDGHRNMFLFQTPKLKLYKPEFSEYIKTANDDKEMKTVDVFCGIISYIKDQCLATFQKKMRDFVVDDIQWVITVPSGFAQHSQEILKQAAMMAGIKEQNVILALESLAVIENCLKNAEQQSTILNICHPGTIFGVIDVGGHTTDITVFERLGNGGYKTVYTACGVYTNPCTLERKVEAVLEKLFSKSIYQKFCRMSKENTCHMTDVLAWREGFRGKFNSLKPNEGCTMKFPLGWKEGYKEETGQNLKAAIEISPFSENVRLHMDKLKFDASLVNSILTDCFESRIRFITNIMNKPEVSQSESLILVGGFSGIKLFVERLKLAFPNVDIFVPDFSQFATVLGASLYSNMCNKDRLSASFPEDEPVCSMYYIEDDSSSGSDECISDDQTTASDFVENFGSISITSDFVEDACPTMAPGLQMGLDALTRNIKGEMQQVAVNRANIVDDVLSIYSTIDVCRPIKVSFVGEQAEDKGGVTKEMFCLFWEQISIIWFKGENTIIPYVPTSRRSEARRVFPLLGKIIEHMLCILGQFPPQLCRSILFAIAHPDQDMDSELILEDFLLFLPEVESNLLKQCMSEKRWTDVQKRRLLRFFSVNKMSGNPTPQRLKDDILNMAHAEIIDTSHVYIALMRRGISRFCLENFFDLLDVKGIIAVFKTMEASPEKVAQLVDDLYEKMDLGSDEESVINYLSIFIRGMGKKRLRTFLLWLTGSSSMPKNMYITFNASRGIARAPVAHTCGNVLELPREYASYQDFEREFSNILQNEESFIFTVCEKGDEES